MSDIIMNNYVPHNTTYNIFPPMTLHHTYVAVRGNMSNHLWKKWEPYSYVDQIFQNILKNNKKNYKNHIMETLHSSTIQKLTFRAFEW